MQVYKLIRNKSRKVGKQEYHTDRSVVGENGSSSNYHYEGVLVA